MSEGNKDPGFASPDKRPILPNLEVLAVIGGTALAASVAVALGEKGVTDILLWAAGGGTGTKAVFYLVRWLGIKDK